MPGPKQQHTAKPKHMRDDVVRRKIVADANTVQRGMRTDEEQLALIATRRGTSTRETTRLIKRVKHGS